MNPFRSRKVLLSWATVSTLLLIVIGSILVYAPSTNPSVSPSLITTPNINVTGDYFSGDVNLTEFIGGDMPLSAFYYRVHTQGMLFREQVGGTDYLVCYINGNHPTEVGDEFCTSAYSIGRTFLYGDFTWYGFMNHSGAGGGKVDLYPGGLEVRHGKPWMGLAIIGFGDIIGSPSQYNTITSEGGVNETNILAGVDWNQTRTKFTIEWRPTYITFYVNDVAKANHTVRVPNEPMSFLIETCHWEPPNTPTEDNYIYFDYGSFTHTPYP